MVRELRVALLISVGTVGVGGCLSSLDERDLENRSDGGTAGVTNAGASGTGASGAGGTSGGSGGSGAMSGSAGSASGKGGTAGATASGGNAGTDSEAGAGGTAGDDTPATGGTSGEAGSGGDTSGSGGTDNNGGTNNGGTNNGGTDNNGGDGNPAGGSGNMSGTGGTVAGMGGSSSGAGGTAGSGGSAGTTTLPPIEDGDPGFATRYWDCCKPSCGWSANVPGGTPAQSCNASNTVIAATSQNACTNGGTAYACHSLSPWAVNDQLAYGYVAADGVECGRCLEFQFTGSGRYVPSDAGSAAIRDKHMFVQVVQVGAAAGQFDVLIPGGGLGQFRNTCSAQLGVNASEFGPDYGGFFAACSSASDLATRKSCVQAKCADVFGDAPELRAGCEWYVDWMSIADNPNLLYREVDCPAELINRSGLDGGF